MNPAAHDFRQVDVFGSQPHLGNPVAVVHDAAGITDEAMARFARWTNLSETTFLLPPTDPAADYRLRIFTPGGELPFAGHPTLGSCHAWLEAGGQPRNAAAIVQKCAVGLVTVRPCPEGLAFAAPPLRRSGPLEPGLLDRLVRAAGLSAGQVVDHQWVDNGPGWCALLLDSADSVLGAQPDMQALGDTPLGLVGPAADTDFEVRAFIPSIGAPEDPVTGSLNAGIAQWLIGTGRAPERYVASQGAAIGRAGRLHLWREGGQVWVGGASRTLVTGRAIFAGHGAGV